jgi:predicted negative regulator of RcsB-dependent stress response
MSEEILNNNFQNKITKLIKKNFKNLIILLILLTLVLFGYFFYKDLQNKNEIKLSEQYIQASIQFKKKKLDNAKHLLENIINKKHKFYSPLALYFIIDNKLETDPFKIINFFDEILSIKSVDQENLNLIKIKKAIFLFNIEDEELIIKTLNPITNSDSEWRNMAIRLISSYFLSRGQKIKANEYIQLLNNKIKE